MPSDNNKQIAGLVFKRYQVDGGHSVNFGLGNHRQGIYAYLYIDGECYVGKSIDMARRYAQHLHEYRHSKGKQPIVKEAWFAFVDSDDPNVLDTAETNAIHYFETHGYPLKNKAKTGLPQGPDDTSITLEGDIGIALPPGQERQAVLNLTLRFEKTSVSKSQQSRFESLTEQPEWPQLRASLKTYIDATIPSPAQTAGKLWALSAIPSGRYGNTRRLCTLTIQNLETFVVARTDENEFLGFINMKRPEGDKRTMEGLVDHGYYAADNVLQKDFDSAASMVLAQDDEHMLDWCYRLNIELMRKGGCMVRHTNNPLLVSDLIG